MWYLSGSSCHCSQSILINIERKYYLKTMNVIFFFVAVLFVKLAVAETNC